jgi:hypothetical protein
VRRFSLAVATLALVAGCYGSSSSSPTPGDMTDVQGELEAHGATIKNAVAGDAGCPDQTLVSNARRLELTLAGDSKTYEVYLFRWKDQSTYTAAAPSFSLCVSAFADRGSSVHVETVEISPWRAYGPEWSKEMHDALQQALADAATGQ